ncbi:MAG: DUF2499 domain-containing protein [Thermostichus sp. DG_1_6_bins_120]
MHALSLPTWWIHIASVLEWSAAILMVWQFGERIGQPEWRRLSWAMLPALLGAMCAITWHWFDNDVRLEWVVTAQASLTLVGNCTLAGAAYHIWRVQKARQLSQEGEQD